MYNGVKNSPGRRMEIIIIAILAVLVIVLIWDRFRGQRRLKEQIDALYPEVESRIVSFQ